MEARERHTHSCDPTPSLPLPLAACSGSSRGLPQCLQTRAARWEVRGCLGWTPTSLWPHRKIWRSEISGWLGAFATQNTHRLTDRVGGQSDTIDALIDDVVVVVGVVVVVVVVIVISIQWAAGSGQKGSVQARTNWPRKCLGQWCLHTNTNMNIK